MDAWEEGRMEIGQNGGCYGLSRRKSVVMETEERADCRYFGI
jgi:hypothetical protein